MKILFGASQSSNALEDMIYLGLTRIFGPENVIDVPSKPYFHGEKINSLYCCWTCFNFPKNEHSEEDIKSINFDLAIYDLRCPVKDDIIKNSEKPIVIDGEDKAHNIFPNKHAYFLREYDKTLDHPKNVFPMPLTYDYIHNDSHGLDNLKDKKYDSWCVSTWGVNPETYKFYNSYNQISSHEDYMRSIKQSKIAFSPKKAGMDSMRTWEIASTGTLLFLEKTNLTIPNGFTHEENIIIYNESNYKELAEKYIKNDSLRENIAEKCQKLFLNFHTPEKRVEYMIEKWKEIN